MLWVFICVLCLGLATGGCSGGSSGGAGGSDQLDNPTESDDGSSQELVLQSIALSELHQSTPVGESVTFSALGVYSDGSNEDLTNVAVWTSSNDSIAEPGAPGVIDGVAIGSAEIVATHDGVSSNAATVTVLPPTLVALASTLSSSVLQIGDTAELQVLATYSDGSHAVVTDQVSWVNTQPTVAEIEEGSPATVTALSGGSANLSAVLGSVTAPAVTVTVLAEDVTLTQLFLEGPEEPFSVGTSEPLTVAAFFSDGTFADVTGEVTWTNSSSEIATISSTSDGTFAEGVAVGVTTIMASLDGVDSNSIELEVIEAPALEPIRMNGGGPEVEVSGETFLAEADFDGTTFGFEGGNDYTEVHPIQGTSDDELYVSTRYSNNFGFRASLPAGGTYQIELHYCEIFSPFTEGDRVFDTFIEGELVEDDLDIYAEVGFATAMIRTHFVELQDNLLEIDWVASANNAVICGVKITAIGGIPDLEMTGLTVNPSSLTAWEGSQPGFTAIAEYNFGPSQNVTADASWASSNNQVLAPAGTPGFFDALALGGADVVVTHEGHTAVAQVTVIEPPEVGDALVYTRGSHLHLWDIIPRRENWVEPSVHSDIMILEPIAPNGTVTNLTNLPTGNGAAAFYPSITHDGLYILFSMRMAWQDPYEIYRMRIDGTELTQLTESPPGQPRDNMSPVQLGGGRIAFLSNRYFMKDEYGKQNQWNIFTMDPDGSNIIPHLDGLSGSYDLSVFADGRLVFSRWDYRPLHNRIAIDNFALWTMNTDGTGLDVFWGLHYLNPRNGGNGFQDWRRPQQFPDGRLVTVGVGRLYSAECYSGGFLAVVDPVTTMLDGYTNITPQVPQHASPSPVGRYLEAVPWGNDTIIAPYSTGPVITSQNPAPNWNLVTLNDDGSGQAPLLSDPDYHLVQPRVVQTRTVPYVSTSTDPNADHGVVACDNIFVQNYAQEIGSLNRIPFDVDDPQRNPVEVRLLEGFVLKKTQHYGGVPHDTTLMSDIKSTLGYKVLGEVPVMPDGSFAAKVPANKPILFQAVNSLGQVIQTMPFWTMAGPGEEKRCVGCHDHHDGSQSLAATNDALEGEIADLTDGVIMDFQDDLTSILADKCGGCHSGPNPPSNIDLSGDRTLYRDMAYRSLAKIYYGRFGMPDWQGFSYLADWRGLGGIDGFLVALLSGVLPEGVSSQQEARLEELFPTHAGLLEVSELKQFGRWAGMATLKGNPFYRYVPAGVPDNHDYPEPDMNMWQNDVAPMLVSRCSGCHDYYPTWLQLPGFTTNTQHWEQSVSVNNMSPTPLLSRTGINSNFDNPEWSPILNVTLGNQGHPEVFSSQADPDWQLLLEWIQTGSN